MNDAQRIERLDRLVKYLIGRFIEITGLETKIADEIRSAFVERDTEEIMRLAARVQYPRPAIVCLCGSTRFMEAFHAAGWALTLKGVIVLSVGVCIHGDEEGAHGAEALGPDVVARVNELHLRKIDLADRVYVMNVGGYIGEDTRAEIEYATANGKPVDYLEPIAELEERARTR